MAVTAESLTATAGGEVEASFFPGEDALTRLQAYIDEGVAKVAAWQALNTDNTLSEADANEAVRAHAYARAYRQAYTILVSSPARVELRDQGSQTFLAEQLRAMSARVGYWEEAYSAVLVQAVATTSELGGTTAVPNRFTW